MRWECDRAEMQFFWSRGNWYVKWLDVRRVHHDLVWIWDATWTEVKNVWTCMEVMQYMDGGETWIVGSRCRSGRSVMVVKRIFSYLDASQMVPGWSWGDAVYGPGWRLDITWMKVRHEYQDLFGGETGHGLLWDANLVTWMEIMCYVGMGQEFLEPGSS